MGRGDALPGSLTTLGDRLRARGYATAFITANPNVGSVFGFQRGFDEIQELYRRRTQGYVGPTELIAGSDEITDRAIEWLDGARRPFYLAILSVDPHGPYTPPERFDRYGGDYKGPVDGGLRGLRGSLDAADRQRVRSLYDGEVSFNDESFGRLIDHLRETGELDDTLVVFTADHGEEFWEYGRLGHGRSLADPVLRIPLILRLPAGHAAPPPPESPAELVDVLPTVLDVLDLAPEQPEDLDGRSLLSPAPGGGSVWASLSLDGERFEALRSERWKLVWNLASDRVDLFDLTRPRPEAQPAAEGVESARALQVLREELLARLSVGAAAPGGEAPGQLPPDVEEALRALGYIE
jgi:arylsulfatase A-like enzyme